MKDKIMTPEEAVAPIGDGSVVMIGGFLACGAPEILIDALVAKGSRGLTVISNDTAFPERGVWKLVHAGLVKKLISSHVGTNPEVAKRMNAEAEEDRIELNLVPQGTFVERIRAGGYGLGGILTPTGVGTLVAEGKQVINVGGRDYLLEEPLRADFALVRGSKVDKFGNISFHATTINFNPVMAMAADHVIVGAVEIVEIGELDPNHIVVSGILIDTIVGGEKPWPIG